MQNYHRRLFALTILTAFAALTLSCEKSDRNITRHPHPRETRESLMKTPPPPKSATTHEAELTPTIEQTPAQTASVASAAARIHQDTDLVSLAEIDPTILIDIVFARADNPFHYQFFKRDEAFVRYGTAKKIAAVQQAFMARGLRLKVWSAYRPFPVQVKMFQIVVGNSDWVSDPYHETGKKAHVRGVAIDCTLVDQTGNELAMPTPYLDFQYGAEKMKQGYMRLPRKILANRKLLLDVMVAHGMEPYAGEWWHFQDPQWSSYPVIAIEEFPAVHHELLTDALLNLK